MTRALFLFIAVVGSGGAQACFQDLAATRNYTLGQPLRAVPTPDGKTILFLRSLPRDTRLGLYAYDVVTRTHRALAQPAAAPERLSVEEKARRERLRMTLTGITDYELSEDGTRVLIAQADHLAVVAMPDGQTTPIPATGWIGAHLSPDGKFVAGVRDNDVHVSDLSTMLDRAVTSGGTDVVTHGLTDFAAAEELDRADGIWWSPDSTKLIYEEADSTKVEKHFIADPEHPAAQPTEFRYPRAGTENAKIRLGIIARTGGETTWIDWDSSNYPYVARVIWQKAGKLSLVLLTRSQTAEIIVSVNPETGKTTRLLQELDAGWLNLEAAHAIGLNGGKKLPYWLPDGSGFLWASERSGHWQLELRHADGTPDHAVTPANLPYIALDDVNAADGIITFTANPDRLGSALYRVPLAGGAAVPIASSPGLHDATFDDHQHATGLDKIALADGTVATNIIDTAGKILGVLPSVAGIPAHIPNVEFLRVGDRQMDAAVLRPQDAKPGNKYPVILSVYGGPTVKEVLRNPRSFLENQCLADHGFIVVSLDGRGTPGRDRDWERATKYDFIDVPLQDQIDGLQALAEKIPEIDLGRAGITGWSFGGYFTAMATIRRPDVFKAGVAGAPVVDFADYDTAYTERYLGLPQTTPDAYIKTNVLTFAKSLSRPLLILHGLTDDNVYFQNTVKLTQTLMAAGKPYNLLLLPGTHQLADPVLRSRVDEARAAFLDEHLK